MSNSEQSENIEKWFTKERTSVERHLKRPLNPEELDTLKKFAEIVIIYEFDSSYSDWLEDLV